jgi:hypothetical protein
VMDGVASVAWEAVAGARTYSVARSLKEDGPFEVIASGLTSVGLDGIPVGKGTTYFVVSAVGVNGASGESGAVGVSTAKAAAVQRMMH